MTAKSLQEQAAEQFSNSGGGTVTFRPPATLASALARAVKGASAVHKDKRNEWHKYDYASMEAVVGEARDALADEGLSIIPVASVLQRAEDGSHLLVSRYLVQHTSGETREVEYHTPVIPEKGKPLDKSTGAARTYALGYFLRDLLLLPRVEAGADVDRRDDREPHRNGNGHAPEASAPEPNENDRALELADQIAKASSVTPGLVSIYDAIQKARFPSHVSRPLMQNLTKRRKELEAQGAT